MKQHHESNLVLDGILLVWYIANIPLAGAIYSFIWNNFPAPIFNLPVLTMWQALGLSLFVTLLRFDPTKGIVLNEQPYSYQFRVALSYTTVYGLVFLSALVYLKLNGAS